MTDSATPTPPKVEPLEPRIVREIGRLTLRAVKAETERDVLLSELAKLRAEVEALAAEMRPKKRRRRKGRG